MNRAAIDVQSAAAALVAVLEEMTTTLARAAGGDVDWLRPLASSCAEIEYSARFGASIDAETLAAECRELEELLALRGQVEFARRYADARASAPSVRALHDRALVACRSLAELAELARAPTAVTNRAAR